MISRKAKFFVIMLVFPRSYNLPFCCHSAPLRLFNVPSLFFIDTSRSFMETIRCFTYPLRLRLAAYRETVQNYGFNSDDRRRQIGRASCRERV